MAKDDARRLNHATPEAPRIRARELVEAAVRSGGRKPSSVARAWGVTARTMDGERMWSFRQAPEGGRAGRKRGFLARHRRGGFGGL